MKRFKHLLFFLLALCAIAIPSTIVHADDDDDVKPKKVTEITSSKKTIYAGDEFELKAKLSPADSDEDYLKWSIVGKKGIIKFDDDDKNDDEVEFKAIKAGTTKVRCSIKGKGKKYSKTFTVKVKKANYNFSRIGKKTIKVEKGDDFELKVKKSSGLKDKHLKWSIKNTKIVDFDDDNDRYGDDIELDAKKIGKTTVTCTNIKTKKTIQFTVQVITDDDSDDDNDDDDDDDDD